MRVRIVKPMTGEVDGIQLKRLLVGCTYDMDSVLANYLLANHWAEPIDDTRPALVVPWDSTAASVSEPIDTAADRPPRQRKG